MKPPLAGDDRVAHQSETDHQVRKHKDLRDDHLSCEPRPEPRENQRFGEHHHHDSDRGDQCGSVLRASDEQRVNRRLSTLRVHLRRQRQDRRYRQPGHVREKDAELRRRLVQTDRSRTCQNTEQNAVRLLVEQDIGELDYEHSPRERKDGEGVAPRRSRVPEPGDAADPFRCEDVEERRHDHDESVEGHEHDRAVSGDDHQQGHPDTQDGRQDRRSGEHAEPLHPGEDLPSNRGGPIPEL